MRVEPFPFSHGSLAHFSFSAAKKPLSNHQMDVTAFSSGCAPALMTDQARQGRDAAAFALWARLAFTILRDATRPQRCHSESAPLHFPSLKFQFTPSPANQYCHLGHRGILACFFMPHCRREQLIVLKSYKHKQPSLTRSRFLIRAGAITLMPPKVPRKPPINLDVKLVNKELK